MPIEITETLKYGSHDPKTKAGVSEFLKFYKKLQSTIQPRIDGFDRIWRFNFKAPQIRGARLDFTLQEYEDNVYFFVNHNADFSFNIREKKFSEIYLDDREILNRFKLILKLCEKQIALIKADYVSYEAKRLAEIPVEHRKGVIQGKLVWKLMPDFYRVDRLLTPEDLLILEKLFDQQRGLYNEANMDQMTVNLYHKYCKVAYDAVMQIKNEFRNYSDELRKASGREQYKRLSDGRYGRLFEIDPDSPEDFADWYKNPGFSGDHPWEILRGGNTTHIDLGVSEYDPYIEPGKNKKWYVFLSAQALSRMLETCKIAVALYKAILPFKWHNYESIKLRLAGTDHMGIMPEYASLHRGWQGFPDHLNVFNVCYLSDFEKNKTKAKKLIQWLPSETFVYAPVGLSKTDKAQTLYHKEKVEERTKWKEEREREAKKSKS